MAQHAERGPRPHAPRRNDCAPPLIVVGLDGSPSSWDAFSWAAGEAVRTHGAIVAVTVVPSTAAAATVGGPFDYAAVMQARHEVAAELKREAAQRADELDVALSFVTEPGDASRALIDVARRLDANLIVVGRSAKTLHRVAGSLSHRLTSRNDAPVVVVVP